MQLSSWPDVSYSIRRIHERSYRPDISLLVNWRIARHRWARKRKKVQIEWRHGKKHGENGGGGTLLCHVVGKISGRRVPVTMILPFPASLARPRYPPPPFPTPDVPPVFKRFSHSSFLSSSLSAFSQPSLFRYPLLSLFVPFPAALRFETSAAIRAQWRQKLGSLNRISGLLRGDHWRSSFFHS